MKEGQYLGGVRDLEDLRQRCRMKECGCWEWAYSTSSNGRPSISMVINGKRTNMNGRRAALTLARPTPIPKDKVAVATDDCPNGLCVNPAHCKLVTLSELRQRTAKKATPELRAAWVKNGLSQIGRLAKLTPEQVQEIRASKLTPKEIAEKYGTCFSNVHRILSGTAWRNAGAMNESSVFTWRPAA